MSKSTLSHILHFAGGIFGVFFAAFMACVYTLHMGVWHVRTGTCADCDDVFIEAGLGK